VRRYGHRAVRAEWSSERTLWTVEVERADADETIELTASWLFSATGYDRYDEASPPSCRASTPSRARSSYERVFAVNLWGVIHGTKAFLPFLPASGDGHLVDVSSLTGTWRRTR